MSAHNTYEKLVLDQSATRHHQRQRPVHGNVQREGLHAVGDSDADAGRCLSARTADAEDLKQLRRSMKRRPLYGSGGGVSDHGRVDARAVGGRTAHNEPA